MGSGVMIRGAGGGGGGARTPIESPDSLRSVAYARILDMVGEGEIIGPDDQENPLSCVFLNRTPIANADGSLNFSNLQVEFRNGTQVQDYIPGFPDVENETNVAVELRFDTPFTRSITNTNLNALRVRLSVAALSKTNTENGDITGHRVGFRFQLSVDGGPYTTILGDSFVGKTNSKYERSYRFDLPVATQGWTLRVERTTPDTDAANIQDTTIVESYAEIIDAKLRYPMTALVGVVIDAEQFNAIPERAYLLRGRIIQVPSNYDPDTRVYTGVWDGTFQPRYSNNPAWCFYDMATNTRYGLGKRIAPELMNKWLLYSIGVYCDGLVDDGFGGQEPRFTCNMFIQARDDATRVMQNLATVFRGIMYAAGGAIHAVADRPTDVKYVYNASNVIDGKFTYSGSSRKVRHSVALVTWNDMADFGRQKVEYVEDEVSLERYGYQETQVIAVGCTSQAQARRLGRYILATERYETDTVTFGVGLDGTVVPPGMIVAVSDPLRAGMRTGGRVKSASINSITVDSIQTPTLYGDSVTVILPNGFAEKRLVDSVSGGVIYTQTNFSAIPVPDSVWLVESDELAAQTFRVLSITEATDRMGYEVTGMQHVPGKFAFVEDGIQISEPPISEMPSNVQPPPTNLTMTYREFAGEVNTSLIVTMEWDAAPGAQNYEVQWRIGDGVWHLIPPSGATMAEVNGMQPGTFDFKVVAVNVIGVRSVPAIALGQIITDQTTPPAIIVAIQDDMAGFVAANLAQDQALASEIIARTAADVAESLARGQAIADETQARIVALLNLEDGLQALVTEQVEILQDADTALATSITGLGAQLADTNTGLNGLALNLETLTVVVEQNEDGLEVLAAQVNAIEAALTEQSPNLVDKPTFNDGSTGTWVNCTIADISAATFPRAIAGHTKVLKPTNTANCVENGALFQVTPGEKFFVSAQMNTDDATTGSGSTLSFGILFNNGYVTHANLTMAANVTGWQLKSAEITVPAGATSGRPQISNLIGAGLVYLTELSISRPVVDASTIATALDLLEARVDATETSITSMATSITALNARTTHPTSGNVALGTAVTGLTARVTATEQEIDSVAADLTTLAASIQAAFQAAIGWDFVGDGNFLGFTAGNGSLAMFPPGGDPNYGALALQASTVDPNLFTPLMALPGRGNTVVRAMVRRRTSSTWQGALYWATTAHGISGTHVATHVGAAPAVGVWSIVEWDMTANADWNAGNNITQLRLDFAAANSAIVDIRWIAVGGVNRPGASAQATRVLEARVLQTETGINATATDITNLQSTLQGALVAGKNQLMNPAGKRGVAGWINAAGSAYADLTANVEVGNYYIQGRSKGGVSTYNFYQDVTNGDFIGKQVTFACDVYLASGGASGSYYIDMVAINSQTGDVSLITTPVGFPGANVWHRISVTSGVLNQPGFDTIRCRIRCVGGEFVQMAWRNAKLEIGGVATAFTDDAVYSSATTLLQTQAKQLADGQVVLMAKASLTLDVNGYITGWAFNNNGDSGDFEIVADRFKITTPGQNPKTPFALSADNLYLNTNLNMGAGRIITRDGGFMKVEGVGFGIGNEFVSWFGPEMPIANCSRGNSISYLTKGGAAYFKQVFTGARTMSAYLPYARTGDEVTLQVNDTAGGNISVLVGFARSMRGTPTLSNGVITASGTAAATVQLFRKIGTAAETLVATYNYVGGMDGGNEGGIPAVTYVTGQNTFVDTTNNLQPRRYRAYVQSSSLNTLSVNVGSINYAAEAGNVALTSTE